jgi:hypothetical protein
MDFVPLGIPDLGLEKLQIARPRLVGKAPVDFNLDKKVRYRVLRSLGDYCGRLGFTRRFFPEARRNGND